MFLTDEKCSCLCRGGFEIHRNGKVSDVCGGFQAHLSSFASSKVLEMVRKLPQKIVFNEVSRPCAWPIQFKEAGAQEDNIALYFFAKDLERCVFAHNFFYCVVKVLSFLLLWSSI